MHARRELLSFLSLISKLRPFQASQSRLNAIITNFVLAFLARPAFKPIIRSLALFKISFLLQLFSYVKKIERKRGKRKLTSFPSTTLQQYHWVQGISPFFICSKTNFPYPFALSVSFETLPPSLPSLLVGLGGRAGFRLFSSLASSWSGDEWILS